MSPHGGDSISFAGTTAHESSPPSSSADDAGGANCGGGGGGGDPGRQRPPRHRPVDDSDFDVYARGRRGGVDSDFDVFARDGGGGGPARAATARAGAGAGRNAKKKTEEEEEREREKYDRDTRCMARALFTLTVLTAAGFLTWKYGLDEPRSWEETKEGFGDVWEAAGDQWKEWDLGNFTDVLDGLDGVSFGDLFGGDPMLGDNTTFVWDKDHVDGDTGGLRLTLMNALDDTWQSEFDLAVSDWMESDALRLTTERVAVDYNCGGVDGVMVVCNANFGATGWVGINENSIVNGNIVSSVAKMNEYYLRNAEFDHRRFTMCHEIGHGER
jgi:hypothetical protein